MASSILFQTMVVSAQEISSESLEEHSQQVPIAEQPEDLSDMQILQECRIVQQVTRRTKKLD